MSDVMELLDGGAQEVNLREVTELAQQLLDKGAELAAAEERVKALKEEYTFIEQTLLPEKMGDLREIKLKSGQKIIIEPFLRANIKVEDRQKAFTWLDQIGESEIVKTSVVIKYGRGEIDEAKKAVEMLQSQGFENVSLDEEVHWQTLNAWAKDQENKGREWPEFIGIFRGKKAKVK
jgi:hypothetical protein